VKEYIGMNWLRIRLNKIFVKMAMDLWVCEGRKFLQQYSDCD
jgi:hypothetical protein